MKFKKGYSAIVMKQTEKSASQDDAVPITLHQSTDKNTPETSDKLATTKESGGYENSTEPTRYGDWEIAGRCIDF